MTTGSLGTTDRTPSRSRRLAQQLASPLRSFIATEAGSAGLLLAATVAALVWVNSPFSSSYYDLWTTELSIRLGDHAITEDLHHWVNDGLMVFFFFVVGLEVAPRDGAGRADRQRAAEDPGARRVAGHLLPALLYLALNPSGDAAQGWGVGSPPTPPSPWACSRWWARAPPPSCGSSCSRSRSLTTSPP